MMDLLDDHYKARFAWCTITVARAHAYFPNMQFIIWSLTLSTTECDKVTETENLSEDEQTSPFEFRAFLPLT